MHNFRVAPHLSESEMHTNMDLLERAANADMYSHWCGASDLEDIGAASAATYVTGTTAIPPHWELANAVTSGVGFYVRRHAEWRYGSFDVVVHWSSNAAGNNVLFTVNIDRIADGGVLSTFTAESFAVAADSGAGEFKTSTLSSAAMRAGSLVDASHMGLYVRVRRNGGNAADTNTGTASIYGLDLIYNEAKRTVGGAIKR